MAAPTDELLRESARHRGLKLLKSRRRKPGGDFGHYGLAGPDGTPVFGAGDDGLTATAAEVADYLRKGDVDTWATSVETTSEQGSRPARAATPSSEGEAAPAIRPRASRKQRLEPAPGAPRSTAAAEPPRRRGPSTAATAEPAPTPELSLRPAMRSDAAAIAALIRGVDPSIIAERLAAAGALGEAVLVADQGSVIGCLAWHVMPTLQHGPIARITLLTVAPDHQRRGIGRGLVDMLAQTAAARDLPLIEAISDITIESAHGFFRRLGFTQTSYRFARAPTTGI